ncbi:MAG TPA: S41 family peptidase [Pyrinomonadaceae bacterium]|nr:S41 family peptidase [Pyrinomonadaceae bacterium]
MKLKDEIKKNYYDPNYRGMDRDARFQVASDKIKEAASIGQILGIIAQVLIEFDDSHTFFLPPQHQTKVDYGWTMRVIGDDAISRAKKYKGLILDLRGNGGGWVSTMKRLVANFCDHDVKIADSKERKETKPLIAKTRGDKTYTGKLTILVDSDSASASELLARTMQLEKRGTVIGDQTAGAVMTSRQYGYQTGLDVVIFYGVSVTVADMIMPDGNSLEHHGVVPDEVRLPTAEELAAGRDVVMSYAASLHGVTLDPIEAGKLFDFQLKRFSTN